MKYLIPMTCSLMLIVGCAPKLDDLEIYTEQVRSSSVVNIEPYPMFETQPAYVYTSQNLRSPFLTLKDKQGPVVSQRNADCIQPDNRRTREPLESYGLDALEMTGNFEVNGRKWVLINSNDGVLHKATRGSRIGLFHGTITHISDTDISITQLLPDGAGCWQPKATTLTGQSATGDNNG